MNHFHSPVVQTNDWVGKFTPTEGTAADEDHGENDHHMDDRDGESSRMYGELQKIGRRSRHSSHRQASSIMMASSSHHRHHQRGRNMMEMDLDVRSSTHHTQDRAAAAAPGAASFMDRLWYPQLEQDDDLDTFDDADEFASDDVNDNGSDDDSFGRSLQDDWLHYSSSSTTAAAAASLAAAPSGGASAMGGGFIHGGSGGGEMAMGAGASLGTNYPFYAQAPEQYHPPTQKHRR
mmetsp:Transcript_7760/g.22497  ORF Transcript_7760/g.22497 Transcript_7760/m.22497 type:complete len:234 (-) Transcript_7760:820-1521(-)